MRFLRILLVVLTGLAVTILVLRLLFPLPPRPSDPATTALPARTETRLGAALMPPMAVHEGRDGIVPLADGRDALAARILLLRAAEESVDLQYYIWQTDTTGWILLDEVRAAAERGVRVRLLLDDNGIPGLDPVLAGLDALPGVEVRIFNPFTLRQPKALSYAFDFFRLNRRMHNKSMTVDGIATILGGRNIGDIYFAYGEGAAYFDLDVLAIGPLAADVGADFDRYWSSDSAYPAGDILAPDTGGLAQLATEASAAWDSARGSVYAEALADAPVLARVLAGEGLLEWTSVRLVSDDPAKGLGRAADETLLVSRLPELLGRPARKLVLVSAYLVPGEAGTGLIEGLHASGVEARVLTNSLEATDVPVVHAGWIRYRERLGRAGAEVRELRARPEIDREGTPGWILGGSQSSLHAKTFAVDDERIFIGSFNFDPRSARLNTEMGVLVDSAALAIALSRALDGTGTTYRVMLDPDDPDRGLVWIMDKPDGTQVRYDHEPNSTSFQRGFVRLMSLLPVEWML
ncbi:MAG: phospholipase D family protein [Rubellimicrobium sp.]|nr:phospholipase D family protein [Rubellimicrobium sp.]